MHFANFLKKCGHHFWLEFYLNFLHFSDVFWLFLTCEYNKQKWWIIEILINHLFAIFKVSRSETFNTKKRPETFETDTCKNGSWDESWDRDQVSTLHHCLLVPCVNWKLSFYPSSMCIFLVFFLRSWSFIRMHVNTQDAWMKCNGWIPYQANTTEHDSRTLKKKIWFGFVDFLWVMS